MLTVEELEPTPLTPTKQFWLGALRDRRVVPGVQPAHQRLLRRVRQLLRGIIAQGLEQAESDLPVRLVRDNERLVNEPSQRVGYRSDSCVTPIAHGLDRFFIASTCKDRQS